MAFGYYDADFKCAMVMEADWSGFILRPRHVWDAKNVTIASFNIDIDKGLGFVAREYLGTTYDYAGALGLLMSAILKIKSPFQDSKAVFCSEVAVLALQHSDFEAARKLYAYNITPGQLLDFMKLWLTP